MKLETDAGEIRKSFWHVGMLIVKRKTALHCFISVSDINQLALEETWERNALLLSIKNHEKSTLKADAGVRGPFVFAKRNIPVELLEPPAKFEGMDYTDVRIRDNEGLYKSSKSICVIFQ